MEKNIDNTDCMAINVAGTLSETAVDYSAILKGYDLPYTIDNFYFKIGESSRAQGWILHISVVIPQLVDLLNVVLPVLIDEKVPFKIARNKEIAKALLGGQLGYTELGKVICIYPYNDIQAASLAQKMIGLTKPFKGPHILTDLYLGAVVYTRYGAFNPITLTGTNGSQEQYINDGNGNMVRDIYTIPFILPAGINWPFTAIAPPALPKPETILQGKYKRTAVLKSDAKGDVVKALFLKKFLQIKCCVIKEGKQNMMCDDHNRDIRDRLLWQQQLHNDLHGEVPVPKVYDLFEENGDSYLIMEYIKGEPLDDIIVSTFQHTIWEQLKLNDRLQLLDYALQIIDSIERIHRKGYVHRDINTVNFLVTKKQKLVMIDLELAYSEKEQKPSPPFMFGTAGFMSPQQQAVETPTVKEDIYAIGATLLAMLTGLLPSKFEATQPEILKEQLGFFYT